MLDAFRCIPRILTIGGIVLSLVSGFSWHGADSSNVQAAELNEVRAAFYRGDYEDCMTLCQEEVDKGIWNDFWAKQLITTQLLTGRYEAALETYESVASKFSNSLPLRMLGAEAYRYCGQSDVARRLLEEIPELVQTARWRYNDRENLLAIGRYSLSIGEDARNVLSYYDAILKLDATYVDAHIAIAELAIEKADYQEAVNALKLALELRPDDPWIRYLLAKAWSPSDSSLAAEHLDAALELNPRQVESLLLVAENHITAEDYDAALVVLEEVLGINNSLPAAWALRAAIAHLRGNYAEEGSFRKQALEHWTLNPEVDFLIGQTLSRHYRFVEGVQYQRRALKLDPQFVPAKFQLAQDLLRTGEEQQGWMLVDQVSTDDKYNVVAFNLKTLQARLEQFTTLEIGSFLLRMDAREAKIYGPRVAELLLEAEEVLTKKYQAPLKQPVAVEIFPQQSDFAIRTFGLPGGAGFLGVCFGPLITANSPASQGETPSNWESVLWHEFCHVVTLQKTNNRMPRWLSEGISVYEELERDSRWGQRMNPRYKQMLLGGDFTPLSELSGAFLSPKSPLRFGDGSAGP